MLEVVRSKAHKVNDTSIIKAEKPGLESLNNLMI